MKPLPSHHALIALSLLLLTSVWGIPPQCPTPPKKAHPPVCHTPYLPTLPPNSPFRKYADFWNQRENTGRTDLKDFQQARLMLYQNIAEAKTLSPEQRKTADLLSLHLAHATLMANARCHDTDTPAQLNRTLEKARKLRHFRDKFPEIHDTQAQAMTEQTGQDPFALELEIAMENTTLIRKVTETWKRKASVQGDHQKPSKLGKTTTQSRMLILNTTIIQPGDTDEKLFLVLHSLPHNATVWVNGMPQTRTPENARCSFRVPLAKTFPEQKKFKIDIHIPHPPQNLNPKAAWLVKQNK